MQSLDLNLASRPFRNNTLLWACYGLAVVLLVAFSVWNYQTYSTASTDYDNLKASVANVEQRMKLLEDRDRKAQQDIRSFNLRTLQTQTDKANDVISWRAFSWTRLFNILEWVQPYDVRMTSVRPVFLASERTRATRRDESPIPDGAVPVRVRGIAKDREAFLELQRELLVDPRFDKVEPERVNTDPATNELTFELGFLYFPSGYGTCEDRASVEAVQARGTPQEIYCTEGLGEPPLDPVDPEAEAEAEAGDAVASEGEGGGDEPAEADDASSASAKADDNEGSA
ncbi:hypothetical protein ABI59_02065 [Acidobacteria bacterium Mor1]|nr:hypothetical protein ABI59_02065 [Acidobacteria bacterium Mor1]